MSRQEPPRANEDEEPTVWTVLPTYNERGNLATLVPALLALRPDLAVVVVDDGSPDGTGEAAARLARETRRVHLLQRGARLGYSSAVRQGLRYALDHGAALLLQADADWSHHPKYVPELLRLVESECEVAIGSRYVEGCGTRNWALSRRLLSRGANLLVRWALRLPTRDCTGGFRCYRRAVVEQSGLLDINTEGYAFLLATIQAIHRDGWRVREVPIVFVDRQFGSSKLSKWIILEAALVVSKLALRRFGVLGKREARRGE